MAQGQGVTAKQVIVEAVTIAYKGSGDYSVDGYLSAVDGVIARFKKAKADEALVNYVHKISLVYAGDIRASIDA